MCHVWDKEPALVEGSCLHLLWISIVRCRSGVDDIKVRLEAVRQGFWESEQSLPGSKAHFLFLILL